MATQYAVLERPQQVTSARVGRFVAPTTILSLVVAGTCFLLYPAIRPFSDEASLNGAAAFASPNWIVAHSLAMGGFLLLSLAMLGLRALLRDTAGGRLALGALLVTWIGVGLTLPYYGAESFGLHAVGQEAISEHSDAVMTVVNSIRWEAGIWFILMGLIAVGLGTILLARAVWKSGTLRNWSAIPLALGFALFIPQFTAPQPVRIAQGALIMLGCVLVASSISMRNPAPIVVQ